MKRRLCLRKKRPEPLRSNNEELVVLRFNDFTTTVVTIRGYVVAQMGLTGGGLYCNRGCSQKIVSTMHATFRRGFFILLDGHNELLSKAQF
jgi:hypothetical protein